MEAPVVEHLSLIFRLCGFIKNSLTASFACQMSSTTTHIEQCRGRYFVLQFYPYVLLPVKAIDDFPSKTLAFADNALNAGFSSSFTSDLLKPYILQLLGSVVLGGLVQLMCRNLDSCKMYLKDIKIISLLSTVVYKKRGFQEKKKVKGTEGFKA